MPGWLLLAALLAGGMAAPSFAQTGTVSVERAWARATAGAVTTGGAYMTLVEHGTAADRLVAVSTPVAGSAELHVMATANGVMQMRAVAGGIAVEPGKPTELKPGGYHVMLVDLKHPLKEGERFPMTLTFEKAGKLEVTVTVGKPGASAPPGDAAPAMPGMKM
jgi:copper(I)-binding protein